MSHLLRSTEKLHEANVILIKYGALTGVIVYQYWLNILLHV